VIGEHLAEAGIGELASRQREALAAG